MAEVIPCLWFPDQVEEAVSHYVATVPGSRIDYRSVMLAETPGGPEGSVRIVEFTLAGHPYMAFQAKAFDSFNHSISLTVSCADQAELDRVWDALSEGGQIEECGWLRDRWGVSWQIVPEVMGQMMKDPDQVRVRRVTQAMLSMVKLDIATLERAYRGEDQ